MGWNGIDIHTVDKEEYSYIAAYFVLFLLPRGGVVNRSSRDADKERVWSAGEASREEVDGCERTSIQNTCMGLGLGLGLVRLPNREVGDDRSGETLGVALHTLHGHRRHRRSSHAGQRGRQGGEDQSSMEG